MQALSINQNLLKMEYAVRGLLPQRALELKKQGRSIISCEIGNPHAFEQVPLSYPRQVISFLEYPHFIDRERRLMKDFQEQLFSENFLNFCENLRQKLEHGLGIYTDSHGFTFIREAIANFINQRDQITADHPNASNPEHIFLTNGTSEAVKNILELIIQNKNDGIMVPIPQYPLYSASILRYGGQQVNYYPNEKLDWALNSTILEKSFQQALQQGINVKAIVSINPSNPTGAILNRENIQEIINFAAKHDLIIIADEVYQENVYDAEFISFAKILENQNVMLCSLHSISKGFYGECGHRGGYLEIRNPKKIQDSQSSFIDVMAKQASVSLCSNTVGQLLVYLMVSPPPLNTPEYFCFQQERDAILQSLQKKAHIVRQAFQYMKGVECFGKTGAMYLFPRLNILPKGTNDFDYCMQLLENTGICTVNGSGFGQEEGTNHLRIAFLPSQEQLEKALETWIAFHNEYVK